MPIGIPFTRRSTQKKPVFHLFHIILYFLWTRCGLVKPQTSRTPNRDRTQSEKCPANLAKRCKPTPPCLATTWPKLAKALPKAGQSWPRLGQRLANRGQTSREGERPREPA